MEEVSELIIGNKYSIELYPADKKIKVVYKGKGILEGFGERHLFVHGEKNKSYIAMDNHWLIKTEDGTLTYNSVSLAPVERFNKTTIREKLLSENPHDAKLGLRLSKFLSNVDE